MEKARVRETGEIVDAMLKGFDNLYIAYYIINNDPKRVMSEFQLEFFYEPDYWEKLKHQAAISAMQGLVTRGEVLGSSVQEIARDIAEISCEVATALVEKLKGGKV